MGGESYSYACDDGTTIETVYTEGGIQYSENGQAFVFLAEAVAASGEQYSNGSITFHAKGEEASVMVFDQIALTGCALQN